MATRAEKIAFLQAQQSAPAADAGSDVAQPTVDSGGPKTRAEKIAFIQAEKARPKSSIADTALEHFGKGASLGYLPQLQAGAEQVMTPALNFLTGNDVKADDYLTARDKNIKRQTQQAKDNPITAGVSDLAGGLATGIATSPLMPGAGAATTLGGKIGLGAIQGARTGLVYGAVANPGDVEGVINPLQLQDRGVNAIKGGLAGAAIGAAAPVVGQAIKSGAATVSDKLKTLAEKSAVNATGATGKQASNFNDTAGRELLDRGIVKFGDTQSKIAERASAAVDAANKQIDDSLTALEAKGVKVDGNAIYKTVRDKISELKSDPSQADIAKHLESELDNLINSTETKGTSDFGVKEAEQIKRGYNRKAGNWADPEKSQAGKTMYQSYRGAVEDAAQAADPATAKLFEEGKKSYGLLAPIQEAAERRAATTAQSPAGGLADLTAAGVGALKGGPVGMVVAPVARRVLAPRLASSIATSSDYLADQLRKVPQLAALEAKQPAAFQSMISRLKSPDNATPTIKAAENKPTKGPDKWAADGQTNLIAHDPTSLDGFTQEDLKDPKTKDLMIQASDLKPGSKAMEAILSKIKARKAAQ